VIEYTEKGKENNMSNLKPLNDFIFQKLMGEKGSEIELKSFLSAVLGRKLKEITILENKNLTPEVVGDKTSILDVRAATDDNTHVNIEVQINPYGFMDIRSLFYWSKLYSTALEAGKDYKNLPNVITINILDYDYSFIKLDRFHTTFHLWEDRERYKLTEAIEVHFIEMLKFRKLESKDIVNESLHRWLTFFDGQTDETTIKELMDMDTAIQKAKDRLDFLLQDKEFLHQANLRAIALSDYTTAMNDAKEEGIAEGKTEGREEGKEEAEKKAYEEKLEMVKEMLSDGESMLKIIKYSKFTEEEIKSIEKTL
jgi:predicted transposase/invertase (TIGR01784 family)